MDRKRLDELDSEIARAENQSQLRWLESRADPNKWWGPEESLAHRKISDGIQAQIDLLKAKRINVAAGLEENHGMPAATAIEKIIHAKFIEFTQAISEGFSPVVKEYVQQEVTKEHEVLIGALGDTLGELRQEFEERFGKGAGASPDSPHSISSLIYSVNEFAKRLSTLEQRLVGLDNSHGRAAKHEKDLESLDRRLSEVETRGVKYQGLYQRAQTYERGAIVHYSGSAYVAIKAVPEGEQPNGVGGYWQIFAQRGRDASSRDRRGE